MYVSLFKYYTFNTYMHITKRNLHNNTKKNCICNLPAMVAERRRVPHELYPFSSANAFLTLA